MRNQRRKQNGRFYFYLLSVPTMDENIVKTFSLASNVYKLKRSYFTNNDKFSSTECSYTSTTMMMFEGGANDSALFCSLACDDVDDDIKYFPSRMKNKISLGTTARTKKSSSSMIFLCAVVFNVNIMLNSSTCLYLLFCE